MARNRYASGRPAPKRRQPLKSLLAGLPTTFLWVSVFISTAVLSASLGYVFGQRALSGVSSPVADLSGGGDEEDEVEFRDPRTIPLLNEREIIARSAQRLAPSPLPPPSPPPPPHAHSLSYPHPHPGSSGSG